MGSERGALLSTAPKAMLTMLADWPTETRAAFMAAAVTGKVAPPITAISGFLTMSAAFVVLRGGQSDPHGVGTGFSLGGSPIQHRAVGIVRSVQSIIVATAKGFPCIDPTMFGRLIDLHLADMKTVGK
jgi:hypothetical protein